MSTGPSKRWLPPAIIVALVIAAWGSGLMGLVDLESIKAQSQALQSLAAAHPALSLVGFVAAYAAAAALSLPIAVLLTLLGGFLFGRWIGTAAIVVGATAGATIVFLIARSSVGSALRAKAGPLYQKVAANLDDNLIGYMLFLRLVPLFPFFLVNIVLALFNVRLAPYVLTTFFGIIPVTFVYANLGRQLGTTESLGDLASPQMLLAFTLFGVSVLVSSLYKRRSPRRGLSVILLLAATLFSSPVFAGETYDLFLTLYDGLLQSYVHPGRKDGIAYSGVDYDGWAADARHKEAISLLLSDGIAGDESGNAQKAYWINTYNFLTIDLIVQEGERRSIKNIGGVFSSPWKRRAWALAGRGITLDDIEHRILRPMADPRIHFAINCASVSCPDLRSQAYRPGNLDGALDEQVTMTLQNPGKGLRIEKEAIYVSKILDWFSKDFNNGDVRGWLTGRAPITENQTLKYLDYDWSLNRSTQ